MTQRDFCLKRGVGLNTLQYWMRTSPMKLYRAMQAETIVRLSPEPIDGDSLSAPCVADEIDREIPLLTER